MRYSFSWVGFFCLSQTYQRELKQDGGDVVVTDSNKKEYIQ